MKELDLHSIKHEFVSSVVEKFIYKNKDSMPVKIITGNSEKMRLIVMETAIELGYNVFNYKLGEMTIY